MCSTSNVTPARPGIEISAIVPDGIAASMNSVMIAPPTMSICAAANPPPSRALEVAQPQLFDAYRDMRRLAPEDDALRDRLGAFGADEAHRGRPVRGGIDPGDEVAEQLFACGVGQSGRCARGNEKRAGGGAAEHLHPHLRHSGAFALMEAFSRSGMVCGAVPTSPRISSPETGCSGAMVMVSDCGSCRNARDRVRHLLLEGRIVQHGEQEGQGADICCAYSAREIPCWLGEIVEHASGERIVVVADRGVMHLQLGRRVGRVGIVQHARIGKVAHRRGDGEVAAVLDADREVAQRHGSAGHVARAVPGDVEHQLVVAERLRREWRFREELRRKRRCPRRCPCCPARRCRRRCPISMEMRSIGDLARLVRAADA